MFKEPAGRTERQRCLYLHPKAQSAMPGTAQKESLKHSGMVMNTYEISIKGFKKI